MQNNLIFNNFLKFVVVYKDIRRPNVPERFFKFKIKPSNCHKVVRFGQNYFSRKNFFFKQIRIISFKRRIYMTQFVRMFTYMRIFFHFKILAL